jgi:hypothetical protein
MPNINALVGKIMKKTNIVNTARTVIYNKYVLYVVFLAALFDLLRSAVNKDYLYCIIFILVGFLMAFFNKNMTVILILTVSISTILRNVINGAGLKVEGFNGESEDEPVVEKKKPVDNKKKPQNDDSDPGSSVSGKALVAEKKPASSKELMENLKENALDLKETQKEIISGFEKIEPYMNKAESLIGSIQETALTIQELKNNAKVAN